MTWILIIFPFFGSALSPVPIEFNSNKACLEAAQAVKSQVKLTVCVSKGNASDDR